MRSSPCLSVWVRRVRCCLSPKLLENNELQLLDRAAYPARSARHPASDNRPAPVSDLQSFRFPTILSQAWCQRAPNKNRHGGQEFCKSAWHILVGRNGRRWRSSWMAASRPKASGYLGYRREVAAQAGHRLNSKRWGSFASLPSSPPWILLAPQKK